MDRNDGPPSPRAMDIAPYGCFSGSLSHCRFVAPQYVATTALTMHYLIRTRPSPRPRSSSSLVIAFGLLGFPFGVVRSQLPLVAVAALSH